MRVTATYLFLLLVLRLAGKRTIGEGTPFDFVVALVLGDFPDDVIWGDVALAQGLVAVGTIMTIHFAVAYASYRSPRFDRLVASGPTVVLRRGRRVARGLRETRMNATDLDVQLRHHGRAAEADVARAAIEPTGHMSLRPTDVARAAQRRDLDRRPAA